MAPTLPKLNLPEFSHKIKHVNDKLYIYDDFRKNFFIITQEEWVRQNFLKYMTVFLNYPKGRIAVEKKLMVNKNYKRFDIVFYNKRLKPLILVECKAPNIKIDQSVFDQIGIYNLTLKADYLIATNGIQHFAAKINHANRDYSFMEKIPKFEDIS